MSLNFIGTRAAGLSALEAFVPSMGRRYADCRNYDLGAGNHKGVSTLSPYIRRRLIAEVEVIDAALQAHGSAAAGKFVQEVLWRGYFKGWLERRPQVWTSYAQGLSADLAALEGNHRLRHDVGRAMDSQTGLACFDAWAAELVETGYLHNHARMWFASIWIFTFGLPWRIGADFFYRHLLDGDAASNTLGWRWVAGLHTRGKPYHAQPWNIAKFTGQRFTPRDSDIAEVVKGLEAQEPDGLPPVHPLRTLTPPQRGQPTALLITDEDCLVEGFDLSGLDIRTSATLGASHLRSPLSVSHCVTRFEEEALADAAARVGVSPLRLRADQPEVLAGWAAAAGVRQVITPYITRGPLHDWLAKAAPLLTARGIAFCEWRRDWDSAIWPHATAGFFKVKQQLPRILDQLATV
ncbi:MAG: deoxyribodipyrimidine photolyase [Rhodospirillales bacterium]|nr:deoxyribodipyrimidine photolyase [Rhodospirillales bacterium]